MLKKISILLLLASSVSAETIPVDIPDGVLPRYIAAFAKKNNWQSMVDNPDKPGTQVPNPYSDKQNFFDQLSKYAQDVVVYEELTNNVKDFTATEKERIQGETKLPDIDATKAAQAATAESGVSK